MTPIRQRLFAWFYHTFLSDRGAPTLDDPFTRLVRVPLLAQAGGDVLEIGAGDGANLPLFPPGVRLTLLDPNPYLIRYLRQTAARLGVGQAAAIVADAGWLPFPGERFDTVVSVHVLCSVGHQPQALAEIRRVLRPGVRFLFLEHVTAPPGTATYRLQRLLNPAWKRVGAGCHLTRDTGAAIQEAGFRAVEINRCQVGSLSFVSPHVYGLARK